MALGALEKERRMKKLFAVLVAAGILGTGVGIAEAAKCRDRFPSCVTEYKSCKKSKSKSECRRGFKSCCKAARAKAKK
jgi:hypothetical protein